MPELRVTGAVWGSDSDRSEGGGLSGVAVTELVGGEGHGILGAPAFQVLR